MCFSFKPTNCPILPPVFVLRAPCDNGAVSFNVALAAYTRLGLVVERCSVQWNATFLNVLLSFTVSVLPPLELKTSLCEATSICVCDVCWLVGRNGSEVDVALLLD